MRKYAVLVAVLVLLSLSFGSLAPQNGYDLFQKALAKERGEGNLEEAIDLYKKVVEEVSDESLAAKAQLRIGICYEKLGQEKAKQAQKAFQKVIDNYPGQIDIVKVAREKLITLSKVQTHTEKSDKDFRIRKVMPLEASGAPSPDGRLLSYVDWDTGDGELAVMEIATGEKRRLTHKAPGDKSWYFVNQSIFSTDGKKLAFTRWKNDDTYDLRIINVDGSGQRILLIGEEIYYFSPSDWTLDGKYILGILTKNDKTNQIAYVSASDGNVRIIKEFSHSEPGEVTLSPCGRWIAYDFKQDEESDKRDILLLAADGGNVNPLVKHPADDCLLGWAPSGDWILFSSDRSGTWDAWIVPVKDGKPLDDPRIVKRNFGKKGALGIVPMGFTQKGSFYYGIRTWIQDIYVATLDLGNGGLLAQPEKAAMRFEGSNNSPDWSPDGKYLAYISRRDAGGFNSRALCIQSMDTGEELELFPELNGFGRLSWFPDGESILVVGRDKANRTGLFKVDARTGGVSLIVAGGGAFPGAIYSPDGKKIFFRSDSWEDKTFRIMGYDVDTKQKNEIYRSENQIFRMDISPDGKWLVFRESTDNTLKIIPVKGGKTQVLLELEPGDGINSVVWSPNGKDIFFSKVEKGGGKTGKCELWRISRTGGKPMRFELAVNGLIGLSVHPDGRRIAYVSWQASSSVWVMENFLPKEKTKKEPRSN